MKFRLVLIALLLTSYSIDDESLIVIKDYKTYYEFLNSSKTNFTSVVLYGASVDPDHGMTFRNDSFFNKVANFHLLNTLLVNNCHLLELPSQILNLKHLESLDLGANNIKKIDTTVYRLKAIKDINFEYNKIENIEFLNANNIGFTNIRTLSFDNNKISSIPQKINRFKTLKYIFLRDNYIQKIPCELSEMDYLTLDLSSEYMLVDSLPCCFSQNYKMFWINAYFKTNTLPCCFEEIKETSKLKSNLRVNSVRYAKKG